MNLTVSSGYSAADSSLQLSYISAANYYTIQLAYIAYVTALPPPPPPPSHAH